MENNIKRDIVISFSGGRTSAFMAAFCKEYYKDDNVLVIFANTGREREETLEFVDKCDKHFNLGETLSINIVIFICSFLFAPILIPSQEIQTNKNFPNSSDHDRELLKI